MKDYPYKDWALSLLREAECFIVSNNQITGVPPDVLILCRRQEHFDLAVKEVLKQIGLEDWQLDIIKNLKPSDQKIFNSLRKMARIRELEEELKQLKEE